MTSDGSSLLGETARAGLKIIGSKVKELGSAVPYLVDLSSSIA